ncbi:MAG: PorT family protein [Prevotella sp.]|nr:PorT family protein [Prevotella sp.]
MNRLFVIIIIIGVAVGVCAQERTVQNKPYIDLRPMHFGILVGFHAQDIEFKNVGPQTFVAEDGTESVQTILCDQDTWNPGFSVGVLADLRLGAHLNFRITPTMHFGAKRLTFRNLSQMNEAGNAPLEIWQDMKNTYISVPLDLKFSAERFNNYRPYIMAGINPMINLSGKAQDYMQLKRYDAMIEVGLGCDLYLPFFKLIPELKFCYGLTDVVDHHHATELTDINKRAYANSVASARSKMIVLTFYFE